MQHKVLFEATSDEPDYPLYAIGELMRIAGEHLIEFERKEGQHEEFKMIKLESGDLVLAHGIVFSYKTED